MSTRSIRVAGAIVGIGLLAGALACSEDDGPTSPGQSLSFATILSASYSGIDVARAEVIRDEARWASVWADVHRRISPAPALPSVDFAREMVVLVAVGQKGDGCWAAEIRSIRTTAGSLLVRAEERHRASCACTAALTQPVHLVRAARAEGTPSFEIDQRTVSCQ